MAYFIVQLMTICAVVKWKCAVESGNFFSFILRYINEPSIYNAITVLYSVQFEPMLSISRWFIVFSRLKMPYEHFSDILRKTFQLHGEGFPL